MIEVHPSSLNFDDIAVNDMPNYRPLKLKNKEPHAVVVQLSASSPFIRFQEKNENFSALKGIEMGKDDNFTYNELFDSVGLLQSIQLGPNETKELVVSFQANPTGFAHLAAQSPPTPHGGTIELMCVSARQASASSGGKSPGGTLGNPGLPRNKSSLGDLWGASTRSESLVVPFSANVFVSYFQISTAELQTTMTVGKTQLMDFSIANLSSRPLSFVIRMQNLPVRGIELELYESEHFEEPKFGRHLYLEAHESMKLSLMARTVTTATNLSNTQFQAILQCDNLRDCRNTGLVYVSINVVRELQGDMVSLPDTSVNFGDVYRGGKTTAEVKVNFVGGKEEVVVKLGNSHRWKCEGAVSLLKDKTAVEELTVTPGKGKSVTLCYQPSPNASNNKDASKIQFELELFFLAGGDRQQKVVVRCFAVLYTSTITVSQTNINFGDCQVGQSKRYTFSIENHSPLPGSVFVQLRSKIISIEGVVLRQNTGREINEEFSIAPSSSLAITLRITPQRVNSTYQKQLFITNASNPKEERLVVTIEANNMPPTEAKLHNELYTWEPILLSGVEKREENRFNALTNTPLLLPYMIHSKVDYPLLLSVRSTSNEIEMFYLSDRAKSDALDALCTELNAQLYGGREESNKPLDAVAERVESLRKDLLQYLSEGEVLGGTIHVEPLGSLKVYAILIRSTFTSEVITKEDGLMISVPSIEVPRFVRLSYKLCSTSFELLGQKTKNFGEVNIGTKKTTKLSLLNRCKSILYVCISKSRSVTAGHIRIGGSDKQSLYLALRPFATKEIEVIFHPGIKGVFEEKIRVYNVLDPKNAVSVTLKASVIKVDTFDISPDTWSFGPIVVPSSEDASQNSKVGAKFIVSNTSKTRRQIRLQLNTMTDVNNPSDNTAENNQNKLTLFEGVEINVQIEIELMGASSGSTRKIEEQIEKLQHKLKIYERKKKTEKAKAAVARIEALKRALLGEEIDLTALDNQSTAADTDVSESEEDTPNANSTKSRYQFDQLSVMATEGILLPVMNAGEAIAILFGLYCSRNAGETLPPIQTNTVNLLLFEAKDQEINRIVPIDITVVRPEGETGVPSSSSLAVPHLRRAAPPPCLQLIPSDQQQYPTSYFMGNPLVVLSNSIVEDHTEFRFLVKSALTTTVVVLEPRRIGSSTAYALEARFKFFPRNGLVKKDEPLPIVVECTPRSVGPQKYVIPVKNLQNTTEIRYFVVEMNPTEEEELLTTEPKELLFPDLITPCHPTSLDGQLLLIRSRFNYPHYLNIRASKPSQIRLYEDVNCTIPLEVPVQRNFVQGMVRVYVRYEPSPKAIDGEAHTIVGGVVVESVVSSSNEGEYNITGRAVVRVSCKVGGGFLSVANTNVDLGSVAPNEHYVRAHVKVTNTSDTFTIRARLRPPSPSSIIAVGEGKMESISWSLAPREERNIPVQLQLHAPGLVVAHLVLENLSCLQDSISISFTTLRLDESISASFPPGSHGVVVLPVAPVTRDDSGTIQLQHTTESSMTIRNSSNRDLMVASQCEDFPIVLCATPEAPSDRRPSSALVEDASVELLPHQSTPVYWRLVDVPILDDEQIEMLTNCHIVRLQSTARVYIKEVVESRTMNVLRHWTRQQYPTKDQCVLIVPVTISLAVSDGMAEPQHVNFGTVGVAHRDNRSRGNLSGDPASVKIQLKNLSDYLPLRLQVESQPVIRFSSTRMEIPPGGALTVDASLQLKQIPTQGPFRYEAFFINQLNSENDIAVTFTGQYYWKVFHLTYHGNPVKDSVGFPPLRVNNGVTSSILSEMRWNVSVTEQAVELDLSIKHNSELEGLLELLLLNHDATSNLERLRCRQDGEESGKVEGNPNPSGNPIPSKPNQDQRIRLRCIMSNGSALAKLANVFFGTRKIQTDQWTFDTMAENEKRLRSITSNNIWIGTVIFSNPLTEEEEIELFGVLEPFQTFSAPSKLMVLPVRGTQHSSYSGELSLNQTCEEYTADLTLRVLFSEHLTVPLRVEIRTVQIFSPKENEEESVAVKDSVPTVFFSTKPKNSSSSSSPSPGPTLHTLQIPAKKGATLQVSIFSSPEGEENKPTPIQQSLLEQYVGLVVMDSNAPFSVTTLRVGVIPNAIDEEEDVYESAKASTTEGKGMENTLNSISNIQDSGHVTTANASPEPEKYSIPVSTTDTNATNTPMVLSGFPETAVPEAARELKMPEPSLPVIPTHVLSLKNCAKVPGGCTGAYVLALSFPKEEPPQPEITIKNNLTDRSVEYQVGVISQGPQPWLLLGSTSAMLEAGETQSLRLNVLSVDAGSYVGYLSITNTANPTEVVYLRLAADVFVPTTGEGLFEVIASSGQRVTSNTVRLVPMGHVYGGGSMRAHVALEITNRGSVALEFPVSVVKPFRMELKPLQHLNPLYTKEEVVAQDADPQVSQNLSSAYTFNGKLVVCHVYGVATASGQKYVVVDPKSRVRLVFLLMCNELRTPAGYGLACEADVVFRCKQTRDSHFTFQAKFDLFPPSFEVEKEHILQIKGDEEVCCEAKVVVKNLLQAKQSFAFRSQSPIVYVVTGSGEMEADRMQFEGMGDPVTTGTFYSFATLEVPPKSEGYFLVRIDATRATTLLSGKEERPQLSEHAHILNVQNPTERVRINFFVSTDGRERKGDVHPIKYGGQHISEHFIFRFAQKFSKIMTGNEESVLHLFRFYDSKREAGVETISGSSSSSDIVGDASFAEAANVPSYGGPVSTPDTGHSPERTSHSVRPPNWEAIKELFLDLIWIVDELVFYSILLCNSRRIEGYCAFVAATVVNHPVMRAWWLVKDAIPTTGVEHIFVRFLETLDTLPCATPSLS